MTQTAQSGTHALSEKTIVIFGGTSGMGLAAAQQATALGAKVIVIGSDAARAAHAASTNGLFGYRVADVTDPDAIENALADIPEVDHLVLLAGSFVMGAVRDADVSYLRRAFDERIWATVHAIRALGGRLAKTGSVTLISGALADRPNANGTAIVAAAAAANDALARGLALELAPTRVNAISPGSTDTPLLARALGDHRDAVVAQIEQALPIHRLGTAAEVGEAIVFLMANGFMNGATLHIDGGSRLI